jgi:hypothetical protein
VTDIEIAAKDDDTLVWKARWSGPDGRAGLTETLPLSGIPPVGSSIAILTDPTGKRESIWEGDA